MRIHVVCVEHTGDQVLARHAGSLVRGLGCSVGNGPDPRADANIYMPYLLWSRKPCQGTRSVAWFTHYDTGSVAKAAMWELAAREVTVRASMAQAYLPRLAAHGQSVQIPPFVDLEHFTPGQGRPGGKRPRVGLSGMVYPGGRKGEHLAARLVTFSDRWDVVATGKGWPLPIPSQYRDWGRLPDYYRSLDVYVCTALVEGGPVTVLEALATGVPVVIPRGVGMCDEYPDVLGIERYEAGDYEDMVRAIEVTTDTAADPEALRWVAERYSETRWLARWQGVLADRWGGE